MGSPFIFNGNFAKALTDFVRFGKIETEYVDLLHGSADPSAGAGVEANQGSMYIQRINSTSTALWQKQETADDTSWEMLLSGGSVLSNALNDGFIFVGNGANIATGVAMSGEATIINTGAITLTNSAVIGKVLTGFTAGAGNVAATDTILQAFQKIDGNVGTKLNAALNDTNIFVGNGANVATGVAMSGEASIANTGAITLSNSAVIGKVLTGFTSGAGTVSATDTILQAFQKIDGNVSGKLGTTLADTNIFVGNGANVATAVAMSGEATIINTGAVTLSNSAVIGKVITGFTSGAGTLLATDTILQAIQKLDGNIAAGGLSSALNDGFIFVGNASNIATGVAMSGEATIINTGAVTLSNSAVIGKVLTGFTSGAGTVAATDTILQAIQKLDGNDGLKLGTTLTNTHIFVGNGSNIATGVAMSGEATIANTGAVTLDNAAVIGKVLTGYTSGAGTVSATDTILQAIQKLNGNIAAISGSTITVTAGENLAAGDAVYISVGNANGDTGRTQGEAYKLDATNDERIEFIGFATGAITAAATGAVAIAGPITGLSGLTIGEPFWASVTTPGAVQMTAPSADTEWIIQLGVATSATTGTINAAGSATAILNDSSGGGGGSGSAFLSGITVTANYTLQSSDNGTVIWADSSGGAFDITIPQISTLPAEFNVTIKDYTGNTQDNPVGIILADNTDSIDDVVDGSNSINETFAAATIVKKSSTEVGVLKYKTASDLIVATGGTITTVGDFKVHTFTSSANFEITSGEGDVEYLIIAGGGGGGGDNGGGGGAGGYRTSTIAAMSTGIYPVVVGGGGAGGATTHLATGTNGSDSSFNSVTSVGGGAGGGGRGLNAQSGNSGGSGGGGGGETSTTFAAGGTATSGQGTIGGTNTIAPNYTSGGGGGASIGGTNGGTNSGPGGAGTSSSITGSAVTRAGGGGGGASDSGGAAGAGGAGGGGAGGNAGTANTGGGGGGGNGNNAAGLAGGSGIVILRYQFRG